MMDLLAKEYHDKTERYDRMVCTGPIVDGAIRPSNGKEHALINVHAKKVLAKMAEENNVSTTELHKRVRNHYWNYCYGETIKHYKKPLDV
jgi:hypothetical protein